MTGALTQAPPRQQLHHEVFAIVWGCLPWSASLLMGERADGLSQVMVICIILLLKSEKKRGESITDASRVLRARHETWRPGDGTGLPRAQQDDGCMSETQSHRIC